HCACVISERTATMPAANDLAFASVVAVRDLLDQRQVSSRELSELMLARIDQHDRTVNGYIAVTRDEALAAADAADQQLSRGGAGTLLGVPIAIKDLADMAGVPTTAGSRILADNVATTDSTVVAR